MGGPGWGTEQERLFLFLCDHRAHDRGIHFLALILGSSEWFTSPQNQHFGAKLSSPATRTASPGAGEGMSLLPVCCPRIPAVP